jgi:type VI secretion system secreted protein Hcp
MYLDVQKPRIDGESQSPNQDWNAKIEIQHMHYSISQDTSLQTGTGLVSSGAKVSHVDISKVMDKSTPMLWFYLCSGQPLDMMTIRVSRPGAAGPNGGLFEAESYIMENVIVSSYSTSGSPGAGSMPSESWTFSFTKITEKYQTVDDTGRLQPMQPAGFDFGLGTAV